MSKTSWLSWQKGRQNSGYHKLPLIVMTWPLKFDMYLLRFPEGCCIPAHTDPSALGRHYRLNIVLKQAKQGGEFICSDRIFSSRRIKFFRPDVSLHAVSQVLSGRRYVLSMGWLRAGVV